MAKRKENLTGAILAKLERAIAEADLSKVPTEKLLALRLQYAEAAKQDTTPKRKKLTGRTLEEVLSAYTELLNGVRAGRLTAEQAQKENAILSGMVKAIEAGELKKRIEEIEHILNE